MTSFATVAIVSILILAGLLVWRDVHNQQLNRELLNRLLVKHELPPITQEPPSQEPEAQSSRRLKHSSNHSSVRFNQPEVTKLPVGPLGGNT